VLGSTPDIEVVGESKTNHEAIDLAIRLQPTVVIMATCSPNREGLGVLQRMSQRVPGSRVLVLTTFDLEEDGLAVLQAGASGFLPKDIRPDELTAAIRTVAAGQAAVSPGVTRALLDRLHATSHPHWETAPNAHADPLGALTRREREVFMQVFAGRSNAEIAAAISTSEATVKTHVTRLLSKLDLRDRVQAVIYGYENSPCIETGPVSNRH
jgi:DNA-binding NarL/FixJ family response regulator